MWRLRMMVAALLQPLKSFWLEARSNSFLEWYSFVFRTLIKQVGRQLGRMRLSYLPPLMVYLAAGISGITSIVGLFFVKERLGLSAEFLAALGFWAGLPWAIKMPLGHIVDLIWRWKGALVVLGAGLIGASILIMIGLLSLHAGMLALASIETWFVLAALLSPLGYVLQDVVADAMTVEAVPRMDQDGNEIDASSLRSMHIDMQTLGRVAIVGGGILVAALNVYLMDGVGDLPGAQKTAAYLFVYQLALVIPLVSVLGVMLSFWVAHRAVSQLVARGHAKREAKKILSGHIERPPVNWWILGGGLVFVVFSLAIGLSKIPAGQEIIFLGTMAIVIFLMLKLVRVLQPEARRTLLGIAVVIFFFRAMPGVGDGAGWWTIDVLKFDQGFLSVLDFISGGLVLLGMFIFRRFMAERSIPYVIGFITIVGTILYLPSLGMFYGLHEWTAAHTGGIVDARFIALANTALASPLGQIAMIPMLAWIANSAPENLKATFFAIMASFTNLALSASQLGTKYLNQIFTVTREVKEPISGVITIPANYSELGLIMITTTVLGLLVPLLVILWHKYYSRKRCAA